MSTKNVINRENSDDREISISSSGIALKCENNFSICFLFLVVGVPKIEDFDNSDWKRGDEYLVFGYFLLGGEVVAV